MKANAPAPDNCLHSAATPGDQADAAASNSTTPSALPQLDSQQLLRGQNAVAIAHNGALYRLQTTRQGKLILTK